MQGNKTFILKPFYIVALAVLIVAAAGCQQKKASVKYQPASTSKKLYTCPMHQQIIRDKPGQCPICSMDLVKKETEAARINNVELSSLLQPPNSFVVSSVAVTTMRQSNEPIEIEVLGTAQYDTRTMGSISSKVNGRIEKLYIKYNYQNVKMGQQVMDIYSPELLTAEQNLLFILKNDAANASLISAAKQRLLLLGVTSQQLQQIISSGNPSYTIKVYSKYSGHIHDVQQNMTNNNSNNMPSPGYTTNELSIKEGMYLQIGQPVFLVFNPGRLWALLNLFPGQQLLVKAGDSVSLTSEANPSQKINGIINYIEPYFRKENKTLSVRVYFDNTQLHIPVGSQLKATIYANSVTGGWLPRQAVVSMGINKVVFLKSSGGFEVHKVETGIILKDKIQITNGLDATDSVAVNGQFLIDSESFIKVKK